MDKLFDQILKNIPPEIIPALIAISVAFFGVYYFKGLRNYTDAVNDPTFLTLAVLISSAFIVFYIQKPATSQVSQGVRPLLLVPRFEDDERRQFETLFTQQLQAFVGGLNKDASIVPIDVYIRDRESARLTGKSYSATAVLEFDAKRAR